MFILSRSHGNGAETKITETETSAASGDAGFGGAHDDWTGIFWNLLECSGISWNVPEQILSLTSPLQLRRKLLTYLYSLEFDIQKQCILYLSSHQLINRPNLRWPYLYFWIDFFVCRGHTLLWNSFLEDFPVQNWTCITWMPCSWHQKSNSPILQFSNLKSCKMPLK